MRVRVLTCACSSTRVRHARAVKLLVSGTVYEWVVIIKGVLFFSAYGRLHFALG